jgi:arginyl-tRNA synthetase
MKSSLISERSQLYFYTQKSLSKVIEECYNLPESKIANKINLEFFYEGEHGDFASNISFILSPILKKAPLEIAHQLQKCLLKKQLPIFEKIEIGGGGFINFFLTSDIFIEHLQRAATTSKYAHSNQGEGKRVLIEFISANPTGPLNVVNARAGAIGDAIAHLLKACGYEPEKEYYINDVGRQVELFGQSVEARYKELEGEKVSLPKDGYHGEYVKEIAKRIKKEKRNSVDFSKLAVDWMIEEHQRDLSAYGVEYHRWFRESSLHERGEVQKTLTLLQKKNVTYWRDNALWLKTSSFGDTADRVLIKKDNTPTYFLPDIAYHINKFERGFDWIIDIFGPDHHGYIPRLKAAINVLDYPNQKFTPLIVQQVNILVKGQGIKMSKRSGEFITLKTLLETVGKDVARFFFLMRSPNAHLDFDLELAKKESLDNPVFYVQYAHARATNILRYALEKNLKFISMANIDFSLLNTSEEKTLLRYLTFYPEIVYQSALQLQPHSLLFFLLELAKRFHYYYTKHRVVSENISLTQSRLFLTQAIKNVIKDGLSLLGIETPERM